MPLKHTDQNLLSIPMGISVIIHILLLITLASLSWNNTVSKPERQPIKIKYVAFEPKQIQKQITPLQKTAKPAKGNSRPLKITTPLKATKPFQPAQQHSSTVSKIPPLPVEPTTPNTNTGIHIKSAAIVSNSIRPMPVSTNKSKTPTLIDFSSAQSTPIHTSRGVLSNTSHTVKPTQPSINGSTKSSVRIATRILTSSGYSSHNLQKEVTPRAVLGRLNPAFQKVTPAPSLNVVERWIPRSKSNPVQIASIPSEFFDETSKGSSQTSGSDNSGHPAGETDSSGQDLNAIRKGYSSIVWGKIAKAKYYPSKARKRGWEGNPIVEFKLARNGDLLSSTIARTSSHKILNEAALNAVKNAVPYPQIPEMLKIDSIRFKLPISFILDEP